MSAILKGIDLSFGQEGQRSDRCRRKARTILPLFCSGKKPVTALPGAEFKGPRFMQKHPALGFLLTTDLKLNENHSFRSYGS